MFKNYLDSAVSSSARLPLIPSVDLLYMSGCQARPPFDMMIWGILPLRVELSSRVSQKDDFCRVFVKDLVREWVPIDPRLGERCVEATCPDNVDLPNFLREDPPSPCGKYSGLRVSTFTGSVGSADSGADSETLDQGGEEVKGLLTCVGPTDVFKPMLIWSSFAGRGC